MRSTLAGLTVLAMALAGCAGPLPPSATPTATVAVTPTAAPTGTPSAAAGGCGDSQVFAGPGPDAALGLADNPWAAASPGSAEVIAYFWLRPPALLRVEDALGNGTKVLWIIHGGPPGPFAISAHPLDAAAPVVQVIARQAGSPAGGYPSDVAVPTPGCWRFEITSGSDRATLDILVAPASAS
jgi:hypothetical protein